MPYDERSMKSIKETIIDHLIGMPPDVLATVRIYLCEHEFRLFANLHGDVITNVSEGQMHWTHFHLGKHHIFPINRTENHTCPVLIDYKPDPGSESRYGKAIMFDRSSFELC